MVMTTTENKTIFIKRTFDLPLKAVWKVWTEAESFKKWWGPIGYTCPDCNIDFKQGGKYLMSMQGPDGIKIWGAGTFKEIVDHKKIVYTDSFSDSKGNVVPAAYYKIPGEWPLEFKVTVELEEVDGKTNTLLLLEGIPEELQDDCVKGWQQSFDKLEKIVKQ
jgi:uncharacterized protein YndB with AHSA1/START domain